jgi:hypothetical protein
MEKVITPKQRMLNAYKGRFSDRRPVAPEFWYFYPARILGMNMMEFEREIPHWKALQTTFVKYSTEGWGAAFPETHHPDTQKQVRMERLSETKYRETTALQFRSREFTTTKIFDLFQPSSAERHMADREEDIPACIDLLLSEDNVFDFDPLNKAHASVGEDYLLELWLGTPFFDFIAEIIGFEKAAIYFTFEEEAVLNTFRERFMEYQKELIRKVCANTQFESFVIGCSYSCNSLIGPVLWRKWDKPYIQAMAEELHRHGKLLHIHFHGRSMRTAEDFAEIGINCVCPFERGPGGDVQGIAGLQNVRRALRDRVTFNGNVHTVETLIRGTPKDVRREVQEIKEAFEGSARLIIGTGDQVGGETPEENILAMIDEAKR